MVIPEDAIENDAVKRLFRGMMKLNQRLLTKGFARYGGCLCVHEGIYIHSGHVKSGAEDDDKDETRGES